MKFSTDDLLALTTPNGGRFAVHRPDTAFEFCSSLARSHYENFPVGSLLMPRHLQQHIHSMYAFARIADDIADEASILGAARQIEALDSMESILRSESSSNPIFLALEQTRAQFAIPLLPFQKLLTAFKTDICFTQPATMQDVERYCSCSANPIGELVLRLYGLYNDKTARYSESICTGLQLANFWQDISVDRRRKRIYIPIEVLDRYGLYRDDLLGEYFSSKFKTAFEHCLQELCSETERYFDYGAVLLHHLPPFRLRMEIATTIQGGKAIVRAIRNKGSNITVERPTLRKRDYVRLLFHALVHTIREREV